MQKLKQDSKFFIQTYGCQMNYSDSERFGQILQSAGMHKTDQFNNADLIIFNSCSVRQKAEDRILGMGKIVGKMKEQNPKLMTVLTGCMARRIWDDRKGKVENFQWRQELKKRMPWLDVVIETKKFGDIVDQLIEADLIDRDVENIDRKFYDVTPQYKSDYQAFVPISTGCDHFCSYCIVPFARGREECRSVDSIKTEFTTLVEHGFNDLTLLGQIVNRWVNPMWRGKVKYHEVNTDKYSDKEPVDFLQLLRELDSIDGDYWLTFTSSHPMYFTDQIINYFKESKHVRPFLHFALQSGSDEVLTAMKRDHEYKKFKEIVMKFKQTVPGMALTTDIIVGYPGETEEQFLETAQAMEELEFDMAYISEYSPRLGTSSAKLKDDIPHKEKERRKDYINEILKKTSYKLKKEDVGKILQCLPYKTNGKITQMRTIKNRDVMVEGNFDLGKFVDIEITDCTPWALRGKLKM